MNKKIIAVFFLSVIISAFLFSGCSSEQNFTAKTYSSGDTEVTSVKLDLSDREIEVKKSDDGSVHIEYYESEKEFYNVDLTDGTLTMTLEFNKDFTDFIGMQPDLKYRKVTLFVPEGILNALELKTSNENISMSPVSVQNSISLSNNNGNINFDKMYVGKEINLTIKDGNISGKVDGTWDDFAMYCTVKKGNCNLPDNKPQGDKTIKVDCNNGDVNIDISES